MTLLAPVPVDGLATPYVESIWSYVARLAKVHGVRPKDIHELVRNFCPDPSQKPFGGQSGRTMGGWLAGYSSNACNYVHRLSILTGQKNCWALSLARLNGQLARNVTGCITKSLRWCPRCVAESNDKVIEPLLWQISLIEACPIHAVSLISCCTKCGTERHSLLNNAGSGVCGRCLESLANSSSALATLSRYQEWRQRQVLDLLSYTSDPNEDNPIENGMQIFIEALAWTSEPQSKHLDSRGRHQLQIFRKSLGGSNSLPRLENLIDIAGFLGVSVKQILLTPTEAASMPLNVGLSEVHPMVPKRVRKPDVWMEAIRIVFKWVDTDTTQEMPTLPSLCKSVGATSHGLHQRNPTLYRAYNEKLRLQKQNARRALFDRCSELAAEYVDVCYREGREAEVRSGALSIAGLTGGSKTLTEAAMRKALKRPPLKSDVPFQMAASSDRE